MTVYTITKSNGSVLTTIYPYETSGPGGVSTPFQVGCGLNINVVSVSSAGFIFAGNVATLFGVGFKFTITGASGNNGNYTVLTSTYNTGLNQTIVTVSATIATTAMPGTAQLQVFLLAGDQTQSPNRFVSGFNFIIQHPPIPPNAGANVGSYSVLSGYHSVYDSVSGYTAIPVAGPIPMFDANPFIGGQYQLVYAIGAPSVLDMVGQDSLNWGAFIWENMVRMTEHFADSVSPDINPNIGTNTPLTGQLWYNTSSAIFEVYNGTSWIPLGEALGTIPNVVTSLTGSGVGISVTPGTTGALTIANTGVTSIQAGSGISVSGATGAVTINSTTGGTVTSIAATGGTGISVSGSPITTNGTLTFTLGANLQGLNGLTGTGFVQRTGTNTFGVANLSSGQITGALGYTPYNSSNPSGYISGNQNIILSGAVTGSGTTSIATTLANSGVTAGTYGSSTSVAVVNVNAKGLVIGAATTAIPTFAGSSPGLVPTSPGGTTSVLLANGTWGVPTNASGTVLVAAQKADYNLTSAGLQTTGSLSIALAANSFYSFQMGINISPYVDSIGLTPYYTGSINNSHWMEIFTDGGSQGIEPGAGGTGFAVNASSNHDASPIYTNITGFIATGTAGTFSFYVNITSGGHAVVKAGSYIQMIKVG